MPKLDDYFLTVTSLVRTYKFQFVRTGDRFVIYYHDPSFSVHNTGLEMIVFRLGVTPGKLVNICASDGEFIKETIQRYALMNWAFSFNQLDLCRFQNKRRLHGPRTIIPTMDKVITVTMVILMH